jgi:hypothetical protein
VIVQRKSVIQSTVQKHDKDGSDGDVTEDAQLKFVVSLKIRKLENIYTIEETKYFDQVLNLFDEKWNTFTLDEQTIYQTLNYSQTGISENVPMKYFQTLDFYLR